ncbi:hypothetical protein CYMTET_42436 [Cymbomonas tetramitiformis]|uniref:Uncharacterized protein n=1 Tax=Cymbomonas tetramitiformis TaxID=36881 RepID=A0AAE0C5F8_9CHLO|nr:hypothetical protein CYMTET_42436 [Cymbomonas tetramitiformis]
METIVEPSCETRDEEQPAKASECVSERTRVSRYHSLRMLLYFVTCILLGAVVHDLARIGYQAAVPEGDFYVHSIDVRFPEEDPSSEVQVSANVSLSNYLLLTGFEGKGFDCEVLTLRGSGMEGYDKINHLLSLSMKHGSVLLEPLDIHRNVDGLELDIFDVNVEELQHFMSHKRKSDSNLTMVHLSCKVVLDIKLFGVMPHPLTVFLEGATKRTLFGDFETMIDARLQNRTWAVREPLIFTGRAVHLLSKEEDRRTKSFISTMFSAISITHSTIKGGKHGMVGLTLEADYSKLFNQSYWSKQWRSSQMRTTGVFSRLSTVRVYLPQLSMGSRAFNPLDDGEDYSTYITTHRHYSLLCWFSF